jgi:hypothetical protein
MCHETQEFVVEQSIDSAWFFNGSFLREGNCMCCEILVDPNEPARFSPVIKK